MIELTFKLFANLLNMDNYDWFLNNIPFSFCVDFKDNGDKYILSADLPGIKQEQLHVSIQNNILTIACERKKESVDNKNFSLRETSYGKLDRSFRLPTDAHQESINATLQDGVLTIAINKTPESQPRRIAIKSSI